MRDARLSFRRQKIYRETNTKAQLSLLLRPTHSSLMESCRESGLTECSLVSVVDDDESVRESLPDLLREFGFAAQAFSTAEEFLESKSIGQTKCLILDIVMPGMSGLDLQTELKSRGREIPTIFITAQGDEALQARAFEQGAVKFLHKPFSDTALLEALKEAIRVS